MSTASVSRNDLYAILSTHIGVDPQAIEGALTPSDLGIDSIGVLELEKVLDDRYGIALPEDTPAMTIDQILIHLNSPGDSL
ncbi:acyl carrier protein [Streptomyces iranensis]|uniref:Acyl carrier protein n=1 Tax=Streptomyces iranensis TaxID=576784 RepID=A0A060ZK02_9ACTN|nr:acyl carrier protein [Streptomyces iranensis]MBP2060867.1 acyl carrier protein [Streptomyces iranensis]CDR06328.1 predicted protein [Streptomyces iranensis]